MAVPDRAFAPTRNGFVGMLEVPKLYSIRNAQWGNQRNEIETFRDVIVTA